MPASRARWYFSLRSPYSWLAYRDLRDRHPGVLDALEWLPFWEPDDSFAAMLATTGDELPYVAMSRAKSFYILQDVRRLAAARGLTSAWPVDRAPRWETAHLAYLVAAERDRGPDFVDAVYQARWERGEDISDPGTIAAVGRRLGLDGTALAGAVHDPGIRRLGLSCLRAACADGVFGVPYFMVGRDRYWGVDRVEAFVEALRRAATPTPVAVADERVPLPAGVGADAGHAGGCG